MTKVLLCPRAQEWPTPQRRGGRGAGGRGEAREGEVQEIVWGHTECFWEGMEMPPPWKSLILESP